MPSQSISSPNLVPSYRAHPRFLLCQVQEPLTPLAAALSVVVTYADAWGPGGFPVPLEEADIPQALESAVTSAATSVQQSMPPNRLSLHRVVWAQAEVLARRCQLLLRLGETLSEQIRKTADLVRENVVLRFYKWASIDLDP